MWRMIQHSFNHRRIAQLRNALKRVMIVVVIVIEPYGEALKNGSRKLLRLAAPLFSRIMIEEGVIEFASDILQGLLFEILRLPYRAIYKRGDKCPSLFRGKAFTKKLINRVKVDRKREKAERI